MRRSLWKRFSVVLVLLGSVVGLCVWYGTLLPAPELGAYAGEDDLAADYARYLGEHVSVSGVVTETSPVTIAAEYGAGETIRLRVIGLSTGVEAGERLRVYGVVEPDRTIRAANAFAVPRTGLWYTWTVSFLAGVWVLGRIIRYWRVDSTTWTLAPRAEPLARRTGRRLVTLVRRGK